MLVLSRKQGEGVVIGKDVRIVLLGIKGDKAQIGIEAPREVNIRRDEIAEEDRPDSK